MRLSYLHLVEVHGPRLLDLALQLVEAPPPYVHDLALQLIEGSSVRSHFGSSRLTSQSHRSYSPPAVEVHDELSVVLMVVSS